ncbi:MAG: hypothetical protein P9M08_10735 [Candidatus Erginobacter occultus]|nr:hypothetical protein [Candidatus Erginobacter occultus]
MKKTVLTIFAAALLLAAGLPGTARGYTVNLIYYASTGLMDENMALLEDGAIIQLIFTTNPGWPSPPSVYNGRPTGGDVLWQTTSTGAGVFDPDTGRFSEQFQYDSSFLGDYVYVRFFNAPSWPDVTYYGQTPLHTLSDFFQLDIWDITAGGLYLWTEYPFMIIPEPATWLTLLPGLALAAFIFRKKKKEGEEATETTGGGSKTV